MMPFSEKFFFEFADIVDSANSDYREFAKVAVHNYRLGIGVTDDTDAFCP